MAVLSTLKPVASSNDHVGTREPIELKIAKLSQSEYPGTQRKDHGNHVRSSIELLDSISLENLRLEILK